MSQTKGKGSVVKQLLHTLVKDIMPQGPNSYCTLMLNSGTLHLAQFSNYMDKVYLEASMHSSPEHPRKNLKDAETSSDHEVPKSKVL